MFELLPIIRRKRRPLIEQAATPVVVAATSPLPAPLVAEVVSTEPPKPEVSHDDAPEN